MIHFDSKVRTDTEDLFKKSGILQWSRLNHTPFVVFLPEDDEVRVELCPSAKKLVKTYGRDVQVMVQWRGEWSSDYFHTTVGAVADALGVLST